MPFEDEFSRALREAADASPPPPVQLMAAGAARRGQRRKRRRAVVAGAASAAVLAGVGGLAFQLRPHPTVAVASAATTTATPSMPAAPVSDLPKPVNTATPPPDEQMLLLLKDKLLGAGLTISNAMSTSRPAGPGAAMPALTAAWTVTDSRGSGGVEVTIDRQATAPDLTGGRFACPADITCTRTAQPGGAYLMVEQPPGAAGGEQMWLAQLQRPDGVVLTVTSSNLPGPGAKAGGPTRNAPVLGAAQLSALALDPVWDQVVAKVGPAEPGTGPTSH